MPKKNTRKICLLVRKKFEIGQFCTTMKLNTSKIKKCARWKFFFLFSSPELIFMSSYLSRFGMKGMQVRTDTDFFPSVLSFASKTGLSDTKKKKKRKDVGDIEPPSIDSMKRHGICYSSLKNTWPSKTLNLLFLRDTSFYAPL